MDNDIMKILIDQTKTQGELISNLTIEVTRLTTNYSNGFKIVAEHEKILERHKWYIAAATGFLTAVNIAFSLIVYLTS
jgi:hypothetical protein